LSTETWTWDGRTWTQTHPAISPSARQGGSMAYDAARQRVVLVGGMGSAPNNKGQILRDTWTWDGRSWVQQHPVTQPPDVQGLPLAYDPISHLVIGFYVERNPNGTSHTVAWNGSDWQELNPSTQPSKTFFGTLISDGSRLLFVSQQIGPEGGRYFSQTWSWNGHDWQRLNPRVNLPSGGAMVYDKANGQVVALNLDTWTWDGSTWTRQHPTHAPHGAPYMAYFPALRNVMAWGDQTSKSGDLWSWTGSNWILLQAGAPAPSPPDKGTWTVQAAMSPAEAGATIRKTVTTVHPVLLPGELPSDFVDAQVFAGADNFNVVLRSDQRDKQIVFGILVPNPPPGTDSTVTQTVKFRGVTAQYQAYDSTSPLSQRWLMWNEPGSTAEQMTKAPGVPYFLSMDGMTEREFWLVANSLR